MSHGWRGDSSVEEWLFAEPWRFEFFQAVRILELLHPDRRAPGESFDPDLEILRFCSRVTLAYPASEVQQLAEPESTNDPFTMTVNLLGLAGQYGPLPLPDTERVLERVSHRDGALRDFLDLFHHRLISLLVRIRKANYLSYTALEPQNGRAAFYLYSFFGLGNESLRNRLELPDRSLLHYCGILAQHPRSANGLERMFSDYFRIQAHVTQLVGGWRYLEEDQWTRLGLKGGNQELGVSALVGRRYWDQQSRFEVNLGPLDFETFSRFLPVGNAFQPLTEMARFFAGPETEFSFRLILSKAGVPETKLSRNSRLGWSTWLKSKPFTTDDSQVVLRGGATKLR